MRSTQPRASIPLMMAMETFERLFAPRSVALIGASERPGTVGAVTLNNMRAAKFSGILYLVNPKHPTLGGEKAYPDVRHLPSTPDLGIVVTPPAQVALVIRDLVAVGTKAAVVITAGFAELGERGAAMQEEILAAARAGELRIIGPNCLGLSIPGIGLNASFAHLAPASGDLAFVSQSGALITIVMDWAQPRGIGFSKIVSLGDMADVDFGDVLEYLANDPGTRAILLYVEGITGARKFMSAARAASRAKPTVVMKGGRHAEGAKAARSHTGALAGSDVVYDAAFRRAGMLRVQSMPEMFDAVETLALTTPQLGDRLAILSNGGGPGVLATDVLISDGGRLAQLAPETIAQLSAILPATWSHGNPVDMVGDSPPEQYAQSLKALFRDQGCDAFLVLNAPTALNPSIDAAQAVLAAVAEARAKGERRNVYTAWLGEHSAAPARDLFARSRIPTYETPDDAVHGFMHRERYRRSQQLLMEAPPALPERALDDAAISAATESALAAERRWLDADEVEAVLQACGVPTVASRCVAGVEQAAAAAAELAVPVALKLRSPDITHKSDVGAVALNLDGAERVRAEALAMLSRVRAARPDARIDGFLVQAMANRPAAVELIVGINVDRVFGPVVLFGQGGTAVEMIADTTVELVPLNRSLARAQIERTRVWRLLQGYRGHPPAQLDAIAGALISVGALAAAHPEITELDINPLLADAQGVLALDARIAVERAASAVAVI